MSLDGKYNPYREPNPYTILGLEEGLEATAREIGKAYNDQKKKARLIKDTKDRAARMKAIDDAKAQLLRPDDRVQIDFFILGKQVFVDLCRSHGQRLVREELPTAKIIGPLYPKRPYDELVPESLDKLVSDFTLIENPEFFAEAHDQARLPVAHFEL